VWLSVWSEVQTFICPADATATHCRSCFSKIQIGFTFLVSAHPGSPAKKRPLNGCVCVCVVSVEAVYHQSCDMKFSFGKHQADRKQQVFL